MEAAGRLRNSIATVVRMDNSQMKRISLLGKISLPGTFLAVSRSATKRDKFRVHRA